VTAVLFTLAAMAGALVRVALRDRFGRPATTAVNLLGSFLLGIVIAGGLGADATTIIGTGFCGSLTTMSGLVVDAYATEARSGITRIVTELLTGVGAAAIGFALMV
jgi:CrcB protein